MFTLIYYCFFRLIFIIWLVGVLIAIMGFFIIFIKQKKRMISIVLLAVWVILAVLPLRMFVIRQQFAPQFAMNNLDTVFEKSKAMYEYGKEHLSDETVVNSALFEDGSSRMIFDGKTDSFNSEVTIVYYSLDDKNTYDDSENLSARDRNYYDSGEIDGIKYTRTIITSEGYTEFSISALKGAYGRVCLKNSIGEIVIISYVINGYLGSNPLFPTNPKVLKDISQLTFDVDSDNPWVLI